MLATSTAHPDFGALSCLPVGALVIDARDQVAFANSAAETLLRRRHSDLVGARTEQLKLTRQDGTAVVFSSLGGMRGERCAARRGDGSETLVEIDAGIWRDRRGSVLGVVALLREVTQRGEDSFQQFMELAPDPITVVRDGRVLYANPAVQQLLGYSAAEIVGHRVEEFVHPSELSVVLERIRAAESGRARPIRENLFVGRDQRVVRIQTASSSMLYDGRPAVVSVGRDVTEQRRIERDRERLLADVEAQRTLFRSIFDEAPAGIALLSASDLRFEMVNPAFRAFAPGYPFEGRRVPEVAPGMRALIPLLERVARTGEPAHVRAMELEIRRRPDADLETGYFTFAVVRVNSPLGPHVALLGLVVEETDEIRALARAEEQAELAHHHASALSTVLETMTEAVFVADPLGALTLANRAALTLLGVASLAEAAAALTDQSTLQRAHFLDGAPITPERTPLARALTGETVSLASSVVAQPDGSQAILRTNAAPIRAPDGSVAGAIAVARDVTELEEFDRAKDQFVRVAAHELKTPVAVMKAYAQALLREGEQAGAPRRAMLEAIDRGADRLDRTIRKLLDVSQLNLGHLVLAAESVDVEAMVRRIVESMAPKPPQQFNVEVHGPTLARADKGRLDYVIAALLDNAVRYSPGKDRIDVRIDSDEREVVTTIRDYGCGIPRRRQAHVFERFYRAHTDTPHDFGGVGVDLYLCREVVLQMGGRIWFESEEGSGATFHVALARADA